MTLEEKGQLIIIAGYLELKREATEKIIKDIERDKPILETKEDPVKKNFEGEKSLLDRLIEDLTKIIEDISEDTSPYDIMMSLAEEKPLTYERNIKDEGKDPTRDDPKIPFDKNGSDRKPDYTRKNEPLEP